MKDIYFLIILCYKIIISNEQNQENICDLNHFCDNCTYCGTNNSYCYCNFFNSFCLESDSSKHMSFNFLQNYDGCMTSNGNLENICGESNIELSSGQSKKITFPSTNSSNFVCYYNFNKSDSSRNRMSILMQKSGLKFTDFYIYYIIYNNNTRIRNGGLSSSNAREFLEIIQSNCDRCSIYLYIEDPKYFDELTLTFSIEGDSDSNTYLTTTPSTISTTPSIIRHTESSGGSNTGLIIGLIVGGLALIIGIIIAAILISNCRKKNNSQIIYNSSSVNESIKNTYPEFFNIVNNNREKMDNLFKTELLPKIYTKNNTVNDNYNCTICMEDFIDNSSTVLTTKCGHTFHYKCFKNWTYKNIICPKCPNCNYLILGPESNINLDNLSIPADYTLQGVTTLGITH